MMGAQNNFTAKISTYISSSIAYKVQTLERLIWNEKNGKERP